jgi:hypothetical protein
VSAPADHPEAQRPGDFPGDTPELAARRRDRWEQWAADGQAKALARQARQQEITSQQQGVKS